MTNKSISQLTAGGAVASTDLFPDVQTVGVGPVKVTAAQIGDFILKGTYTSNTLVYDSTNSRIGIGTTAPQSKLQVNPAGAYSFGVGTLANAGLSMTSADISTASGGGAAIVPL